MHYNPEIPVAVFLGPTLPRAAAEAVLPANYYPPVRMGDIYRLIGTGVNTIVIIDGVFHSITPVWQRELLEAIESGIRVIGASSMGALRAAELWPFGMEGIGNIFQWYRDGLIEGDDEVALMHNPEPPFQGLSMPLVNIRYALSTATERGLITEIQSNALLSEACDLFYADRSRYRLVEYARAAGWSVADALECFLRDEAPDRKAEDAKLALIAAQQPQAEQPRWSPPRIAPQRAEQFRATARLHRGLQRADGVLVPATQVLDSLRQDEERLQGLYQSVATAFFLEQAGHSDASGCPEDFLDLHASRWRAQHIGGMEESRFLRGNGLTAKEFNEAINRQGQLEWLLLQQDDEALISELSHLIGSAPLTEAASVAGLMFPSGDNLGLRIRLRECRLLSDWARREGLQCPTQIVSANWQALGLDPLNASEALQALVIDRATTDWLIETSPPGFGWVGWDANAAILQKLQISGAAMRLIDTPAQAA